MQDQRDVPCVIGIAGCSGSGKTTLALELASQLDATLFPLDLYYRDLSAFPLDSRHKLNFDHPDSLESELILEHVRALAQGKPIQRPVYDFRTHTRVAGAYELLVPSGFVIVEGMNAAGAQHAAIAALREMETWQPLRAAWASGFGIAILANLMNNLPIGLIGGAAVNAARATGPLRDAVLIGVDLGPNLSVTGSLATILWLIAIRREGQEIGFWKFLKWGALVMPPALALAIAALLVGQQR